MTLEMFLMLVRVVAALAAVVAAFALWRNAVRQSKALEEHHRRLREIDQEYYAALAEINRNG